MIWDPETGGIHREFVRTRDEPSWLLGAWQDRPLPLDPYDLTEDYDRETRHVE